MHESFLRRRSGVLLHPTSLPAFDDEGGIGNEAIRFVEFLDDAGFTVWQMLPVQPVERFASPYQSVSVHAGNPDFINLSGLCRQTWFRQGQNVRPDKVITLAFADFKRQASSEQKNDYEEFKNHHSGWLDDYILFVTIKQLNQHAPWWEWQPELRDRDRHSLTLFRRNYHDHMERYCFEQYIFFRQWQAFRRYANRKGVLLLGDVPMFPAHDSADVWAYPRYFELDVNKRPRLVAGVPPDYFSAAGQRWGNPVYDWEAIKADQFNWWLKRFHTQLILFDILRLDHFRGFDAVWEIPADSDTAVDGKWRKVPGSELFAAMHDAFGPLPLIAEDLGDISPEVIRLRDNFNLPGMNVLQFAFDGDAANPYLPHNHKIEDMICTGTHDNDTLVGWLDSLDDPVRNRIREYLRCPAGALPWSMIETALSSVCQLAVIPMQDLLGLDSRHRMNRPGTQEGNWQWRFQWDWIPDDLAPRLRQLNERYLRT